MSIGGIPHNGKGPAMVKIWRGPHNGSWYARYRQCAGTISSEEADRIIREARISRKHPRPK